MCEKYRKLYYLPTKSHSIQGKKWTWYFQSHSSIIRMHNAIKLWVILTFVIFHRIVARPLRSQLPRTTLFIQQTVSAHQPFYYSTNVFIVLFFQIPFVGSVLCSSFTFVQITFTPLFLYSTTLHRKSTEIHFVKFVVGNLGLPWFMRFCICVRSLCKWNRFQFAYRTQAFSPIITVILEMVFFRVFRLFYNLPFHIENFLFPFLQKKKL